MEDEHKSKVMKGITEVFTDLGIPSDAVNVVIHENELDNWATAGEQDYSRFKKSE
jgi:4-oxalocrotonate tautomerase